MSIFAFYFVTGLLNEAGWPHKVGRFKKEYAYDALMVDMAFAQSIDWGASLGAGRPDLALQMIGHMQRGKDWQGDDAPNLKFYVEELRKAELGPWATAVSPQEAVPSKVHFAEGMAALSHEQFLALKRSVEPYIFNALLWGLDNPDRYATWYGSQAEDYAAKAPLIRTSGLRIDEELPSLMQAYENSTLIVRNYERDIDPLVPVPPRLLADAEALGWRVTPGSSASRGSSCCAS